MLSSAQQQHLQLFLQLFLQEGYKQGTRMLSSAQQQHLQLFLSAALSAGGVQAGHTNALQCPAAALAALSFCSSFCSSFNKDLAAAFNNERTWSLRRLSSTLVDRSCCSSDSTVFRESSRLACGVVCWGGGHKRACRVRYNQAQRGVGFEQRRVRENRRFRRSEREGVAV
jgi:hypothetical protein